ncbi:uncharacterized protein EI97DRAFT_411336 [Westerdykella ornata]|uniref:CSN8/PSMD8/EIF3K domain-containing protein n=1 Tax=Westerdykella ornata TaxID=318751 RepID=A0A6A6JVJ5_WESOR|nr:uncharacterized protein EI97DRAFT_411336 [Westerdykella ornata]KAF2280244.1 hypothetical protein EI97DRAFT_411336 [Westerdykella ornata]
MRSADQSRSSSRRGASGAWNRLKPIRDDTLEAYSFPSKGETRLNDFKTQETFYNRIVDRYMKFCASTTTTSDLDACFAALSISSTSLTPQRAPAGPAKPASASTSSRTTPSHSPGATPSPPQKNDLPLILTALRKLREAITATHRQDGFALRAYTFNIHAALLARDWESYLPALHYLLFTIHPRTPLSSPELHEYVGYLILDQACRQGDLMTAHESRVRYRYRDRRVEAVLRALIRDDWGTFWRMKRAVDGYQRRIMEFAEQRIRVHALKCLGRAYMTADRSYVERVADRKWEDLVEDGVGWELAEGDRVVIRRLKGR